ncbi:MAG: hypothetical protein KF773_39990 [Deltaproteobacteria bacterium]|nr:hypothetical protein [Deltaproteobacteria bacterium]
MAITGTGVALTYGDLDAGQNNDCPDPSAPAGVISLTIHGKQEGSGLPLTFCIGRPDLLAGGLDLGPDTAGTEFRVVDASGSDASCTYTLDTSAPITGTASATGLCDNGAAPAGFALTIAGSLTLVRTCGPAVDTVAVALAGTVGVAAQ